LLRFRGPLPVQQAVQGEEQDKAESKNSQSGKFMQKPPGCPGSEKMSQNAGPGHPDEIGENG
jgi:hypothetical protein